MKAKLYLHDEDPNGLVAKQLMSEFATGWVTTAHDTDTDIVLVETDPRMPRQLLEEAMGRVTLRTHIRFGVKWL